MFTLKLLARVYHHPLPPYPWNHGVSKIRAAKI
jgi:hypothetical protein